MAAVAAAGGRGVAVRGAAAVKDYDAWYARWEKDPDAFWAAAASELEWFEKWRTVADIDLPRHEWFVGGKLNVNDSCLDRHARSWRRTKAAIIWEGEPGDKRVITYGQLEKDVCRFANVLLKNGVKAKDRVLIYMPMVPEAVIGMLDWNMDPQAAIDLPNFGSRNGPTELEQGQFSPALKQALIARGHELAEIEMTSGTQAIVRVRNAQGKSSWAGGADPRREGEALGD